MSVLGKAAIGLLFLASCCPTIAGPPGDASSQNWAAQPDSTTPTVIDCKGGERGSLSIRKSNTIVRNCTINGDVRIWGPARNANNKVLLDRSRKSDYVTWLRNAAPTNVLIENTTIKATHTIPLYVGPGVTFTTVRNVKIGGTSASTMVYLGAESHHTVIENSEIDATQGKREAIAIDASDNNVISNNIIKYERGLLYHGGIFLYRNCGEDGVIRHTTPSHNVITKNTFVGDGTAVYLSSRDGGGRCYCSLDEGYPLGSSQSDLDHARFNQVTSNKLGEGKIKQGKSSKHNTISQ
jgi:hypothetical protein